MLQRLLFTPAHQQTMDTQPVDNNIGLHWYALWVYRGLVAPVIAVCDRDAVQTYRPVRLVERFNDGVRDYVEEPLIANLLFVRADEAYVNTLKSVTQNRGNAYCYPGTNVPAAISDEVMEMFRLVVRAGGHRLESVGIPIDKGDKVRVTDGIFKGAEGYIRRVHGTKRLVVAIEGVVAVAVAHIPRQFLELVEPARQTGVNI